MRELLFGSQLRRNVASGAIGTGLQIVVFAASYPLYLHFLGAERYGLWLVLATIISLGQLGNLGVNQALTKLVAERWPARDQPAISSLISTATALLLVTGGVTATAVTLARGPIVAALELEGPLAKEALTLLPLVAALSAFVLLAVALTGALTGLGRLDLSNYGSLGAKVLTLVVSGGWLAAGGGLEAMLAGAWAGYLGLFVFTAATIRRLTGARLFALAGVRWSKLRRLVSFGLPLLGGTALTLLLSPFNKVIIARFVALEGVPLFEIAYQGALQLRGVLEAGVRALVPEVSKLSADASAAGWRQVEALVRRSNRVLAGLGGGIHLLAIALAPLLLPLWLGDSYRPELLPMVQLMLVGAFASLLSVPSYYSLVGGGWVYSCLGGYLVQSAVNVVGVALLILAGLRPAGLSPLLAAVASVAAGFAASAVFLALRHRKMIHSELGSV